MFVETLNLFSKYLHTHMHTHTPCLAVLTSGEVQPRDRSPNPGPRGARLAGSHCFLPSVRGEPSECSREQLLRAAGQVGDSGQCAPRAASWLELAALSVLWARAPSGSSPAPLLRSSRPRSQQAGIRARVAPRKVGHVRERRRLRFSPGGSLRPAGEALG